MTSRHQKFEDVTSWALDARMKEARAVRIAWTVASVFAGIAMLEAVAIAFIAPLKTVEPITILVDRQTGFVQALDPSTPRRVQADAALTNSMLAQYVVAREGFDRATVATAYNHVALWSTGIARAQYLSKMPSSNPESPFALYQPGIAVAARVKSVSPLGPAAALIRFDTQQEDKAGHAGATQPWVAIVRYRYSTAPMSFENRLTNPLGFQVTGYRRDPEAPGPDEPRSAKVSNSKNAVLSATSAAVTDPVGSDPVTVAVLERRGVTLDQIPQGSPLTRPDELIGRASRPERQ